MRTTFFICCLFFIFSCKEVRPADALDMYFENPQPINDSELKKIPSKYLGRYSDTDSVLLIVEDKIIYSEQFYVASAHQSEMDSVMVLFERKDGKLIEKGTGDVWELKNKGDSIQLRKKWRDTLFRLSNRQRAKRIHGKLVLNFKKDSLWSVKILSLENKNLKLKSFGSPADLVKWDSITKLKSRMIDSSTYVLKPTRKEFSTILQIKKLGYDKIYNKIQ